MAAIYDRGFSGEIDPGQSLFRRCTRSKAGAYRYLLPFHCFLPETSLKRILLLFMTLRTGHEERYG